MGMGPADNSPSNTNNYNDDQITDPKLQLAAYAARASKLQARLMATLDVLDSERCAYTEEISHERSQRVALQAQLGVARAEKAVMESERDSLREGVLHLIEKVEVCNDYSLWPHSGLTGTSPAAPAKSHHLHGQSQSSWTASTRAYSAALITALRGECDREHRAHSDSLRRIAELEAQLARREAELEERYDLTPLVDSPLLPLSRDGAIRVLQQSAARNEALTYDVVGLVKKLEDVQAKLERSPNPSPLKITPPRLLRTSSPLSPTPRRCPSPLSLHPSKSSSLVPNVLFPSRSPSPPLLLPQVASPQADIGHQIAAVTQELASLRAEEKRLLQVRAESSTAEPQQWDAQVSSIGPASKRTFQQVLLIEEECIRLRAELAASTAREAALREMLGSIPAPDPVPTEKDVFGMDDDDSEPMDLATPLRPTVLLDPEDLWHG